MIFTAVLLYAAWRDSQTTTVPAWTPAVLVALGAGTGAGSGPVGTACAVAALWAGAAALGWSGPADPAGVMAYLLRHRSPEALVILGLCLAVTAGAGAAHRWPRTPLYPVLLAAALLAAASTGTFDWGLVP